MHQQPQFGAAYGQQQRSMPTAGGGAYGQYMPQQQQPPPFQSGFSQHSNPFQSQGAMSGMGGINSGIQSMNSQSGYNSGGAGQQHGLYPSASRGPLLSHGHSGFPATQPANHSFVQAPNHHAAMMAAPTTMLSGHRHPWQAVTTPARPTAPGPRARDIEECGMIDNRRMCQDEECGGEKAGPKKPNKAGFGLDSWRYTRAMGLLGSTVASGWCQVFVLMPALSDHTSMDILPLQITFGILWAVGIMLIFNGMFSDPGQMEAEEWDASRRIKKARRDDESGSSSDDEEPTLPHRAHKTWLYPFPVMRYDHYCRWLGNSVGLLNHRQFFVMVSILMVLGMGGAVVDSFVVFFGGRKLWGEEHKNAPSAAGIFALCHLAYSVGITYYVQGVWRTHFGLISRNETAKEWASNQNWRFDLSKHGPGTTQDEMSEHEQEVLAETETYYPEFNEYDRGMKNNCMAFWCHPRTDEDGNLDGNF